MESRLEARVCEAKQLASRPHPHPALLSMHQTRLELEAELFESQRRPEDAQLASRTARMLQKNLEAQAFRRVA